MRFRLAETSSLTDLVFPNTRRDTAARRLRRLFDAGYLDVDTVDRTQENRYRLGPAGKRWAEAQGTQVRRAPSGEASHHLEIVGAWSALAGALKGHRRMKLSLVRPDWELREGLGQHGMAVIPDLLVELAVRSRGPGSTPVRLAVEVDMGTERLPVLRQKFEAYERLRDSPEGLFGWRRFGIAVVAVGSGLSHQGRVHDLLDESWRGWWVVCPRDVWPTGLIDMVSRDPQAPLTNYPCRKGGGEAVTPGPAAAADGEGTGH